MEQKSYWKHLKTIVREIEDNPIFEMLVGDTTSKASKSDIETFLKVAPNAALVVNFNKEMNGFRLHWKLKEAKSNTESGMINLLPLKQSISDWREVVYFSHTPADDRSRNFKIIDFFIDEACVGFFINEPNSKGEMYFYEFENEFYPLNLDFEGYFQCMVKAYGIWYWPKMLLDLATGNQSSLTDNFIHVMQKIDPNFKMADFVSTYETFKLRK